LSLCLRSCFTNTPTLITDFLLFIRSLGCTVIELLDGEPPYHDLQPMGALYKIVEDEHPPIPESVSAVRLENDVRKCSYIQRVNRFTFCTLDRSRFFDAVFPKRLQSTSVCQETVETPMDSNV